MAAEALFKALVDQYSIKYNVSKASINYPYKNLLHNAVRKLIAVKMRSQYYSLTVIGNAMGRDHSFVSRIARVRPDVLEEQIATLVAKRDANTKKNRHDNVVQVTFDNMPTPPFNDSKSDREFYERVRQTLADAPPEYRKGIWLEACKRLYPHNYKAQANQPPRGVTFP